MAEPKGLSQITLSKFLGIDERLGFCDDQHVLDSCNVEFAGGKMFRRRGRYKLLDATNVRPSSVIWYNGTVYSDVTDAATNGLTNADAITNPFANASAAIYVGLPFRFAGCAFTLTGAAAGSTTLTVSVFNRTSGGGEGAFVAVTATDGTASGGFTFKVNGTVAINFNNAVNTNDWNTGATVGTKIFDNDLFWIKFSTAATTSGGSVAEISAVMVSSDSIKLRSPSTGMTEFITRGGDRYIVSGHDWPSQHDINSGVLAITTQDENRVLAYDLSRGDAIPLRLPERVKLGTCDGRSTSFVSFNGWLIGPTTAGRLWKWNGTRCDFLEALPGNDVLRGVEGAQSYLTQTPRGTILNVYRNRLMVTGDPSAPLTFYASLEDNDISTIPAYASVGGPNIWPLRYNFNVPGNQGDRIMGAVVYADTYFILTEYQVWSFDDQSLKSINNKVGCVAPASVQNVANAVMFLSRQGVIRLDTTGLRNVSDKVYDTIFNHVNWSRIRYAVAAHYEPKNEYWLWLPTENESLNNVAVVYNYVTDEWRKVSGWYPFDNTSRRDASGSSHSVTAACMATGADGKMVLVSMDTNAVMWQENLGTDDDGKVFPAYVVFKPYSAGESYSLFGAWYVTVDTDGQWIECLAIPEGETLAQEIDRLMNNSSLESEYVQKRALSSASPGGDVQNLYSSGAAWNDPNHTPKPRKIKFGFARNLTKMSPAVIWSPGMMSGGSYTVPVGARGGISNVQIDIGLKKNAR